VNTRDLQTFAARYLEPRLSWLKRRDLPVPDRSEETFVCPVELVLAPIEWIKCSLVLIAPPSHLDREKTALVGVRFVALWRPGADDFDIGVNRGHGFLSGLRPFRHRWLLGPGAGDAAADELAAAVEEQWPAAIARAGNIEGYVRAIAQGTEPNDSWINFTGRSPHLDVGWLETAAYAYVLLGDPETAHDCVVRLRRRDLQGASVARANQIDRLLAHDPAAAVDQLYAWRQERLNSEGLLDLAAPRGFAAARRQETVESRD
jgi:hypothetical protein